MINNTLNINNKTYSLLGGIIHSGSLIGGHYWYIRKNDDEYIKYNDTEVNIIDNRIAINELNNNAYILLYKLDIDLKSILESINRQINTN